jgi:hypothetical protein
VGKQVNTASLELCKELYGLSGWGRGMGDRTAWEYTQYEEGSNWRVTPWGYGICYASHVAYDLGYLLRELPRDFILHPIAGAQWEIQYAPGMSNREKIYQADTPEDAACKLAIELFKQGVLKKEKV